MPISRADSAEALAAGSDAPPGEREDLLSQVGSERQQIYELVRRILDQLDQAAPWAALYYPPDDRDAFLELVGSLLAVVDGIPDRLGAAVATMTEGCDEETRQALEDAEFFFHGIHSMVAGDLTRLRGRLDQAASSSAAALPAKERNLLSSLTADLKGKYASALMGATASIVAEGKWTGVATEPILFPEKADEFRRNEELFAALKELLDAIVRLPRELDFSGLMERWRQGARADQYALTELAAFRATLGRLLRSENRRALYSGDYQQIQQREARLSERIGELEALHRRLWDQNLPSSKAAGTYARLLELALELAAILDVRLLEDLIGAGAVKDLRMVVTSEGREGSAAATGGGSSARDGVSTELRTLVPLLAEEDLRAFVELLLGAVAKRASLSLLAADPAAGEAAADPAALGTVETEEEELLAAELLAPESAPEAASMGAGTQSRPAPAGSTISPRARLEAVEELHRILQQLQAPGNSQWAALRMLQRLLTKHSRVPPSMVQSSHPFLFEILNTLVPQLEVVASFGGVPSDTRQKLVANCMELSTPNLSPEQMQTRVPLALNRVLRLLGALTAVSTGMVRSLRQELGERG